MKTNKILFSVLAVLTLGLSACATSAPATEMPHDMPATEAMMTDEMPATEEMMHDETPTAEVMTQDATSTSEMMEDAAMESPAWYSVSLSDVRTGQAFSIESLKGKVVLVESMAVWCSKCLTQQGHVKALHETLGHREDFVSIGLDIDPNEDLEQLKFFVESQGFDWLYAISPADVSRDLASLYGPQFLNPPSTPIVLIDRHGVAHPMPFGIKSVDELLQFIQPFLNESA
jgi:thiol-disulfide isomerase/thioredoxin